MSDVKRITFLSLWVPHGQIFVFYAPVTAIAKKLYDMHDTSNPAKKEEHIDANHPRDSIFVEFVHDLLAFKTDK